MNNEQPQKQNAELVAALQSLYRGYVRTLEGGRDRIIDLGGDCDPVDRMEADDPELRKVRELLTTMRQPAANADGQGLVTGTGQPVIAATWGKDADGRVVLIGSANRTDDQTEDFQSRVKPWLLECFGPMIAGDYEERNHRFLEEALELVQSTGCTASEAHQLVDYVYGRPVGEPAQEVGGVMVTLAALCLANDMDMHAAAETELARIWTKVEAIRTKQAAKPKHSPLPAAAPTAAWFQLGHTEVRAIYRAWQQAEETPMGLFNRFRDASIASALPPAQAQPIEAVYLAELLARIHRDGGHHQAAVGTEQAFRDADAIVVKWLAGEAQPAVDGGRLPVRA